jgi:hypothetical protein
VQRFDEADDRWRIGALRLSRRDAAVDERQIKVSNVMLLPLILNAHCFKMRDEERKVDRLDNSAVQHGPLTASDDWRAIAAREHADRELSTHEASDR